MSVVSLNKNIMYNVCSTLLSVISPMIVIPVLSNQLGINAYGDYVAIISLCGIFSALSDMGLGMYLPKEIAINRDNNKRLVELFSLFFVIRGLFTLPFVLCSFFLIEGSVYLHLLVWGYLLLQSISLTLIFTGLEKFKFLSLADLFAKLILVVVVLFMDYSSYGMEKAVGVQVFVLLLLNTFLFIELKKEFPVIFKPVSTKRVKSLVMSAKEFYSVGLLASIITQGSTYILSLFLSSDKVAIYSIANQIFRIGQAVVGGALRVLYTSTVRTKDFKALINVTLFSLMMLLFLMPIVFYFSENILSLVFDFNVEKLAELVFYFYAILAFVIVSSFWGYPALSAINKDRFAHLSVVFTFFTYCTVFVFLLAIDVFNLYTAVLCVAISEMLGMLLRLYYIFKFRDVIKFYSRMCKV